MRQIPPYGIEGLAVHVPSYVLDLSQLAERNGIDPAKYRKGLMVREMSIPHPMEDPVTMAAEAAAALMDAYHVDPRSIGMVVVGSESGVDAAKPIAVYIHGLLGLPASCRTFDTKHACYSATAALRLAGDWCRGSGQGRKALIIASDIARYELGSPGEPTQGAGAVAMLVSDQPTLLAFEDLPEASYTHDIMDFWRPNYRSTALVDGQMSIESYLSALDHTFDAHCATTGRSLDSYDYFLFHVPYPKMAYKALRRLFERFAVPPQAGADDFETAFARRTLPTLYGNCLMGNLYSGSLYLSLASLLERGGENVAGADLGLFSYGSGCCGEFFSGRVGSDPHAWLGRIGLNTGLANRTPISYDHYLAVRGTWEQLDLNGSLGMLADMPPHRRFLFHGIDTHKRRYEVLAPPAESCA